MIFSSVFRYRNYNPIAKENENGENNIICLKYNSKNPTEEEKMKYNNFLELLDKDGFKFISTQKYIAELKYENFSFSDIIKKCLPNELFDEYPSSYEMVGNIAHVTLREKFLPYKYLIGDLIIDVSIILILKEKSFYKISNK